MTTQDHHLSRAAFTALILVSSLACSADLRKFVNDGSLIWQAGGNTAQFPPYDPCDPLHPTLAYRAFDITRGPEQMAASSPYPAPPTAFCKRGDHVPTTGSDDVRRSISGSAGSGWSMGGSIVPPDLAYPGDYLPPNPQLINALAPGAMVGPTLGPGSFDLPWYFFFPSNTSGGHTPYWLLAPRQFVGVKFTLADGVHYGWILLDRTGGELQPVEWAYETTPNTPIPVLSNQTYSTSIPSYHPSLTQVVVDSGTSAVGSQDPTVHRLLGPTSGPFSIAFTPTDFANARAGSMAWTVAPHADWFASTPPLNFSSTSSTGNTERTALFAKDFTLPADFDPSTWSLEVRLTVAGADRIGPATSPVPGVTIPGVYLNGSGLAGTNGISTASSPYVIYYPNLASTAHPGLNTLYVYGVSYGSTAPNGTGSGVMFHAVFNVRPPNPPASGIFPTTTTLNAGASLQFTGGVIDPVSNDAVWSTTGGAISPTGLYTAPSAPGTYTVRVASSRVPGNFAQAAVTVTPFCPPDFNHDGELNPDDLGDFITCFFSEPSCPEADYNHDDRFDPDDLGDFITGFFLGC